MESRTQYSALEQNKTKQTIRSRRFLRSKQQHNNSSNSNENNNDINNRTRTQQIVSTKFIVIYFDYWFWIIIIIKNDNSLRFLVTWIIFLPLVFLVLQIRSIKIEMIVYICIYPPSLSLSLSLFFLVSISVSIDLVWFILSFLWYFLSSFFKKKKKTFQRNHQRQLTLYLCVFNVN